MVNFVSSVILLVILLFRRERKYMVSRRDGQNCMLYSFEGSHPLFFYCNNFSRTANSNWILGSFITESKSNQSFTENGLHMGLKNLENFS